MKKISFITLAVVLVATGSIILSGCLKDKCSRVYKIYTPVYKKLAALRSEIKSGAATPLVDPGKMYIQGNWIFLNEKRKGIHIIDNTDPAHPKNTGFINIPGNADIAVKGNILYADLYCDVAAIDISNPAQVQVTKFLTNMFPEFTNYYSNSDNPDSISVLVDLLSKDTTVDCADTRYQGNCVYCPNNILNFTTASATGKSGVAGSMARFAAVNNYLYTVSTSNLNVVDISSAAAPTLVSKQNIGYQIETIFPYHDKLFIGAGTSMMVFDLQDPVLPKALSWSSHWCSGDPVIADDKYAYVTLHAADICNSTVNQLEIYDLQFSSNPIRRKTYPLTNPQGLSKDGNLLFICDGQGGLKVFDASDVYNLKQIKQYAGLDAYDVITDNGIAYISATQGLFQLRYTPAGDIQFLSKISRQ